MCGIPPNLSVDMIEASFPTCESRTMRENKENYGAGKLKIYEFECSKRQRLTLVGRHLETSR